MLSFFFFDEEGIKAVHSSSAFSVDTVRCGEIQIKHEHLGGTGRGP